MTTAALKLKLLVPVSAALLLMSPAVKAQESPDEHGLQNMDPQLRAFIQQALDRNPAVRQLFARYQASLERVPQARSLPEPTLSLTQFLRNPETRVGPQTTSVTVAQQFPWFGKLGDKEKIAVKEAAIVGEQYEAQRDEVVRQVKLAYYDLVYVDHAIAITQEDLGLLQHYETLAEARYAQGVGLQQAVVKLQAELTRDRNRLAALRSRRVDAEATINTLRDYPAATPLNRMAEPERPTVAIDYDALLRTAKDHRPEVQGALLGIERDDQRIQLARKSYRPDFMIGGGFTNVRGRTDPAGVLNPPDQNGKNIFSITVGINIPIRRRKYDAAVAEATEDKIASREGYRNSVNSMEASVRAIGFRIQTLDEQIGLFEHTLLPQAQQSVTSTEAAYSTGTVGVLDLLDSERVLLDVRLGLAQLTSDYMKALSEMERAIGAPF